MTGKVAVVTGAAGGLGQAIAKGLLADGFRVALADLDEAALNQAAAALEGETCAVAVDVGDPDSVAQAHARVEQALGPVEVLVNNAGILSNAKALETTPAEWRRVMAVNLDGPFFMAQAVLPGMKARRSGRIVNIASMAAKSGGLTAGTAYTASKGGVISLTFSLARETAGFGITVNGIAPAHARTRMVTEQLTEAQRQALLAQIPVGRFCEPEEVAHTVRFLVSPLAGFITGEIIDMNGGILFD